MPNGWGGASTILDSNQENQKLQNAKNEVNNTIGEVQNDINKGIKNKTDDVTTRINERTILNPSEGGGQDNPFKLSVNAPTGGIDLPSFKDGNSSPNSNFPSAGGVPEGRGGAPSQENNSGSKSTGNQSKMFGSNDFWVVKLRDTNKPKVEKATIEALPNPAVTFTNIIVGYEFTSGTASVFDLAGRQLQSFAITSRTVPVDLTDLPEGIYIVNINTNIQQDGIKVIKGNGKK